MKFMSRILIFGVLCIFFGVISALPGDTSDVSSVQPCGTQKLVNSKLTSFLKMNDGGKKPETDNEYVKGPQGHTLTSCYMDTDHQPTNDDHEFAEEGVGASTVDLLRCAVLRWKSWRLRRLL